MTEPITPIPPAPTPPVTPQKPPDATNPPTTPPAAKKIEIPTKQVGKAEEKAEVLKQIQDVLAEYKGIESDIPLNHNYWNLVHRFRSL